MIVSSPVRQFAFDTPTDKALAEQLQRQTENLRNVNPLRGISPNQILGSHILFSSPAHEPSVRHCYNNPKTATIFLSLYTRGTMQNRSKGRIDYAAHLL